MFAPDPEFTINYITDRIVTHGSEIKNIISKYDSELERRKPMKNVIGHMIRLKELKVVNKRNYP